MGVIVKASFAIVKSFGWTTLLWVSLIFSTSGFIQKGRYWSFFGPYVGLLLLRPPFLSCLIIAKKYHHLPKRCRLSFAPFKIDNFIENTSGRWYGNNRIFALQESAMWTSEGSRFYFLELGPNALSFFKWLFKTFATSFNSSWYAILSSVRYFVSFQSSILKVCFSSFLCPRS